MVSNPQPTRKPATSEPPTNREKQPTYKPINDRSTNQPANQPTFTHLGKEVVVGSKGVFRAELHVVHVRPSAGHHLLCDLQHLLMEVRTIANGRQRNSLIRETIRRHTYGSTNMLLPRKAEGGCPTLLRVIHTATGRNLHLTQLLDMGYIWPPCGYGNP